MVMTSAVYRRDSFSATAVGQLKTITCRQAIGSANDFGTDLNDTAAGDTKLVGST
jgi:hypothetical protein